MFGLIKSLWSDESGATAVEYGIMVALVAVAIIATVGLLGGALDNMFQGVQSELEKATPAGGGGSTGG
jgi:pilus assembly protein Flp/PilA